MKFLVIVKGFSFILVVCDVIPALGGGIAKERFTASPKLVGC